MSAISPAIQERRKSLRSEGSQSVAISLLQAARAVPANNVNFSEDGLCLRVRETLEVRSLVRLRLTPRLQRPLQCTGRVMWVVQRLDLRTNPPFLFDVGIEFVDPPPVLRQFLARQGGRLKLTRAQLQRPAANKTLAPASLRGRQYVPLLSRAPNAAVRRWHLVVNIDDVPCFSEHYASERAAVMAWGRFKRQQARGRE